ncbi:hypothetical protein [Streptomyces klenkii]|uniref:hypothetical protein n=1 Tax=Streptomyces klenkii TaxID=1420899 RepID=UPI003447F5BA
MTLSIGGFLALLVLGVLLVSPLAVDPAAAGMVLALWPALSRSQLRYQYSRVS